MAATGVLDAMHRKMFVRYVCELRLQLGGVKVNEQVLVRAWGGGMCMVGRVYTWERGFVHNGG